MYSIPHVRGNPPSIWLPSLIIDRPTLIGRCVLKTDEICAVVVFPINLRAGIFNPSCSTFRIVERSEIGGTHKALNITLTYYVNPYRSGTDISTTFRLYTGRGEGSLYFCGHWARNSQQPIGAATKRGTGTEPRSILSNLRGCMSVISSKDLLKGFNQDAKDTKCHFLTENKKFLHQFLLIFIY